MLTACATVRAGSFPVRVLAPDAVRDDGADPRVLLPVCGGIPFPRGALRDVANVRVLGASGEEVPAQVSRKASWPDGSVKWALVDLVVRAGRPPTRLKLVYGRGVRRRPVTGPVRAERVEGTAGGEVRVSGGGVDAVVRVDGGGVVDRLAFLEPQGTVFAEGSGARLVVQALRVEADLIPPKRGLPAGRYVSSGTSFSGGTKGIETGRVKVDTVSVEAPGPIRATVLVRGHVLLPDLGRTLPDVVKRREPPGRLPFSTRLSFYRGLPVVFGQHQLIYTGEPDCDFIARWAIELPGLGLRDLAGEVVLEPGVELVWKDGSLRPSERPDRLVWARLAGGGFALIRHGWENRPAAVTHEGESAFIDFWPREAGYWDLRRYAREWAVGETGCRRENPADMIRYARYAARGMAKSHDFVIHLGRGEPATASAPSYADRAILTAPPGWIAATGALGPFAPEQTKGPAVSALTADLDSAMRRTMDYYIFNQDLYRWHGKLEYGFWQTRSGNIHRTDRWDRDYGRWGWALGDGAGRISHALMLQYVRTLERRYLRAGEAYCRAIYDTNMVHTQQHLENATSTWWTVAGCCHRHNVQPFGCPYIGMRGSYPVGAKILYFVTGDGVIKDGLDLVVDACVRYLTDHPGRLGASGGSDGQGSGANALLFAYETTGERRYLDLCRKMLDKSGLIPPKKGGLGYGPAFGLFNAAAEYAELSGDESFKKRVIETARAGLGQKRRGAFLYTFAMAHRFGGGQVGGRRGGGNSEFLDAIRKELPAIRKRLSGGLTELAPSLWPGHGGARTADPRANLFRDLPYVMSALGARVPSPGAWPSPRPFPTPWPPTAPRNWPRPGGRQEATDIVSPPAELLGAPEDPWAGQSSELRAIRDAGGEALSGAPVPFVRIAALRALPPNGDERDAVSIREARPLESALRVSKVTVQGVPALRVQMAIRVAEGEGRVTSWGLRLPLALGGDGKRIQVTAPGEFRLERWRLDQNDEQIPDWLTSDVRPRWPLWRRAGIVLGPGDSYRIWRANRLDTSLLYTDQGFASPGWLDVTDRKRRFGVTVRLLRPEDAARTSASSVRPPAASSPQAVEPRQAITVDLESGLVEIQFHDGGAPPVSSALAAAGVSGACDIVFHDGWRPPLSPPELTRAQYARLLADLDYGGNHGLFAYRLRMAKDHRMKGPWAEKILESGVEPREVLQGMVWRDGLAQFCKRVGVRYAADDVDGSIARVVAEYRRR